MRPALPELQKYLNIFIQVNKYNFNFKCTCYSLVKTIIMIRKLVVVILIVLFPQIILDKQQPILLRKLPSVQINMMNFPLFFIKNGIVFSSNRNVGLSYHSTSQNKGLFKIYYVDTTGKASWKCKAVFKKT